MKITDVCSSGTDRDRVASFSSLSRLRQYPGRLSSCLGHKVELRSVVKTI